MDHNKNQVLLDGFTFHVACVSDIEGKDYGSLNALAKSSISSLLQSLIIHDTIFIGEDVINPSARFPRLFKVFYDALAKAQTVSETLTDELKVDYLQLKNRFSLLRRSRSYEDELTQYIQKPLFESDLISLAEADKKLKKEDPELFPIWQMHQRLRTRMYSLSAVAQEIAYVPSPYRKSKFCDDPAFRNLLAADIINRFVEEVREPVVSTVIGEWQACPIDLETPPLIQFVLNESQHSNILDTTAEIRKSNPARDFRKLVSEIMVADNLRILAKLNIEMQEVKTRWRKEIFAGEREKKEVTINLYNFVGTKFNVPIIQMKRRHFPRPAYMFLYDIVTAIRHP